MLDAWQPYVLAPERPFQDPVGVVEVAGGVRNARALVRREGPITLKYKRGDAAPPVVILDYGHEIGGYPAFRVSSVKGKTELRSSYSETMAGLKADGDYAGRKRLTRVQVQPVKTGLLPSDQIEGGQRYVRLSLTRPGEVRLSSAAIRFTAYRGTPNRLAGHFLSSDSQLNRIWYAGVYTLNLNQVTGKDPVIIDGAKRDRKIWSGDLLTTGPSVYYSLPSKYVRGSLAALTAGRDVFLPGKCFPDGSECAGYSATYSMAVVIALRDYYRYTGDARFVKPLLGLVARQTTRDGRRVAADGLYSVSVARNRNWNLERFTGKLTYVNAMYYAELNAAADLLESFKLDGRPFRAQALRVKTAANAELWDDERGVYDVATDRRGLTAQDANVMAAVSGLAPPDRVQRLLPAIEKTLATPVGTASVTDPAPDDFRPTVSPYMGGLQLQADFDADRTAAALTLMRTEWGWMLRNDPGNVFWEKMGLTGRLGSYASAAHAWSTAPVYTLSRYVLGLAPLDPDYKRWVVRPQPGDLKWAQGSAPALGGQLSVEWKRVDKGFSMKVTAPKGTSGYVALLLGKARTTRRDGKRKAGTLDNGYAVFKQNAGTHTYSW